MDADMLPVKILNRSRNKNMYRIWLETCEPSDSQLQDFLKEKGISMTSVPKPMIPEIRDAGYDVSKIEANNTDIIAYVAETQEQLLELVKKFWITDDVGSVYYQDELVMYTESIQSL